MTTLPDPTVLSLPSPIREIREQISVEKDFKIFIKRDDLIHPQISGNKWRKLKLNIEHVLESGYDELVTFGGAFSNHVHATASACKLFGIKSSSYIRGTYVDVNNPTLSFARQCGMSIYPTTKSDYKDWSQLNNIDSLIEKHPNAWFVPEGGNNEFGIKGMKFLAQELKNTFTTEKPIIVLPVGTSCTIQGLREFFPPSIKLLGVNVLKYPLELEGIEISNDFHFGGYAKCNNDLIGFINKFKNKHNIQLDPIYTGKMFYGLYEMIKEDTLPTNSEIVAIHTGGLQGIAPFNLKVKPELRIEI